MLEELGKYSLKFAGNTYTSNVNGDVTIHQNWEGTADGYGAVFGTLIFGPTPPAGLNEGEMELENLEWNGTIYSV